MGYQAILDAVRSLSAEEQLRLALQIQDELQPQSIEDDLTSEQLAELDRRIADIHAHPEDSVPWDQVLAEARARHKR